ADRPGSRALKPRSRFENTPSRPKRHRIPGPIQRDVSPQLGTVSGLHRIWKFEEAALIPHRHRPDVQSGFGSSGTLARL
ncbi:MAG: hypothetical protein WBZ24_15260, partial [Anaerolineales bacterium]